MVNGGRPPPPTRRTAWLLLLLLGLLLHGASHLLSSSVYPAVNQSYLPFFFFVAFFLAIRSPPSASRSVAHRFAPQVLGLFPPAALVVHEIGVQLRQAHHLEPTLLEGAVEHAEIVGRKEVERAVRFRRRSQAERLRDRRRFSLEIAVDGRKPEAGREQCRAGVQREGVAAPLGAGDPSDLSHE